MHNDGLLALVAGRRAPGSRRAIPWRILAMLLSLHAIVAAKSGRSSAPVNATEASLLLPKRGAADPTSLDRLDELKLRLTRVLGEALEPTSRRKYKIRVVESEGGAAGGVVSEGQGYSLVVAGGLAAALPASHPRRAEVLELAYELYLG